MLMPFLSEWKRFLHIKAEYFARDLKWREDKDTLAHFLKSHLLLYQDCMSKSQEEEKNSSLLSAERASSLSNKDFFFLCEDSLIL